MNQQVVTQKKRTEYFDYLRIFATFAVIMIHVSAQNIRAVDVSSTQYAVFVFYDSVVRWAVPVFIMISGALFLEGEYSLKTICSKYVLRIVTAFLFWSTLYSLFGERFNNDDWIEALQNMMQGYYHLWYMFAIIGIYLLIPLLKKFTESDWLVKYFLVLSLIFTFIIPQINRSLSHAGSDFSGVLESMIDDSHFEFTLGYVPYFVAGYFLNRLDTKKKTVKWSIYLLGICGFASTIYATLWYSELKNKYMGTYFGNFTINVMLEAVAVFVFVKNNFDSLNISDKMKKVVRNLSKYTFGVYLVHVFVIEILKNYVGLNTLSFNPIVATPLVGVLVLIGSFIISWILNKIPVLNKYIV